MGSQPMLPVRLGINPPSYSTAYSEQTLAERRKLKKFRLSLCGPPPPSLQRPKQRKEHDVSSCTKDESDSEEQTNLDSCDDKQDKKSLPPVKAYRCDASSQPYSKHYKEYVGPNPLGLPCYSADCRGDLDKFTYQKKSGEFYCNKKEKPQELFIQDTCDIPLSSGVEEWQLVPTATWDRLQGRPLIKKHPSTLPDNKRPVLKPLIRRKPKPGEWIEPDAELQKLIKENRIHKHLEIAMPGYTGMRLKNPGARCMTFERDALQEKPRYNEEVYIPTSHLVHRALPSQRPTENVNDHPVSKIVSLLWPYNPCLFKAPKRVGKWENLPPHWMW